MNNTSPKIRLMLVSFHLILGLLLSLGLLSNGYSLLLVFFGILFIIKNKNENNDAAMWSAYMVGAEVLFRMSGGMIFHELPKYSVLLFLLIGLLVETKRHHISISYIIYILLLLIGISFMDIPFNESIRKEIAFNLSGPILLGVSAIYFYKREISINEILNLLFLMILPIFSMLSIFYFNTPDIEDIRFGGVANRVASGGFGPNQVATLIGLGVFIAGILLLFKKRILPFLLLDVLVFIYIIYRGLLTFSRGGMITAFFVMMTFLLFYILSMKNSVVKVLKYTVLISVIGGGILLYTSYVTNGMLINRYTNKNASGIEKKDVSAGRIEIFKSELDAFWDSPFFGIGVGGSKYYRLDKLDKFAATHNEISRLIGEHGLVGIFVLILLIIVPLQNILIHPNMGRAFLSSFFLFWFLTINHSAMRIALPGFIYGLSVAIITLNEKNTLHRK